MMPFMLLFCCGLQFSYLGIMEYVKIQTDLQSHLGGMFGVHVEDWVHLPDKVLTC